MKSTETHGLPYQLARLAGNIFEELPSDEAQQFFKDIKENANKNTDLSVFNFQFLIKLLERLPETRIRNSVIERLKLKAEGKEQVDDAYTAYVAYAAARSAAATAADATEERLQQAADFIELWKRGSLKTTKQGFINEIPTKQGLYYCSCEETDYKEYLVAVYKENGVLLCEDRDVVGHVEVKYYHEALTNTTWKKVW